MRIGTSNWHLRHKTDQDNSIRDRDGNSDHNWNNLIENKCRISIFRSGEREGLFSWIILNQLLGRRLNPDSHDILITPAPLNKLESDPVVLVELGGASAQVVLEPPVSFSYLRTPVSYHVPLCRDRSTRLCSG